MYLCILFVTNLNIFNLFLKQKDLLILFYFMIVRFKILLVFQAYITHTTWSGSYVVLCQHCTTLCHLGCCDAMASIKIILVCSIWCKTIFGTISEAVLAKITCTHFCILMCVLLSKGILDIAYIVVHDQIIYIWNL